MSGQEIWLETLKPGDRVAVETLGTNEWCEAVVQGVYRSINHPVDSIIDLGGGHRFPVARGSPPCEGDIETLYKLHPISVDTANRVEQCGMGSYLNNCDFRKLPIDTLRKIRAIVSQFAGIQRT